MKRRHFIGSMAAATMGVTAGIPAYPASKKENQLGNIGYISGIIGNFLKDDWRGTLAKTAEYGYSEIEIGRSLGESADEFLSYCKSIGIKPIGGGGAMAGMLKDPESGLEKIKEIQGKYWVCYWPWMDGAENITADQCKEAADNLNKLGKIAKKHGVGFCWHNHDKEFLKDTGEGLPFDLLMKYTDPKLVDVEMDLYWVTKGNADPIEMLKRYPGRTKILHVKDMDKTPERSFSCVGDGIIDFAPIFAEAHKQGIKHYFVEKDGETNGLECLKSSAQHLKSLRF